MKTAQEIFEWLKKKGYQTGDLEQEYKGYYDVDMPKILNDFLNENQSQPIEKEPHCSDELLKEWNPGFFEQQNQPQPEKAQEEQEIWEEIFLNYPVGDWLFSREYINEMIKKYSIQTRKYHD